MDRGRRPTIRGRKVSFTPGTLWSVDDIVQQEAPWDFKAEMMKACGVCDECAYGMHVLRPHKCSCKGLHEGGDPEKPNLCGARSGIRGRWAEMDPTTQGLVLACAIGATSGGFIEALLRLT